MTDADYDVLRLDADYSSADYKHLSSAQLSAVDLALFIHDVGQEDALTFKRKARREFMRRAGQILEKDVSLLKDWVPPDNHHAIKLDFDGSNLAALTSAQLFAIKYHDLYRNDSDKCEDAVEELLVRRRRARMAGNTEQVSKVEAKQEEKDVKSAETVANVPTIVEKAATSNNLETPVSTAVNPASITSTAITVIPAPGKLAYTRNASVSAPAKIDTSLPRRPEIPSGHDPRLPSRPVPAQMPVNHALAPIPLPPRPTFEINPLPPPPVIENKQLAHSAVNTTLPPRPAFSFPLIVSAAKSAPNLENSASQITRDPRRPAPSSTLAAMEGRATSTKQSSIQTSNVQAPPFSAATQSFSAEPLEGGLSKDCIETGKFTAPPSAVLSQSSKPAFATVTRPTVIAHAAASTITTSSRIASPALQQTINGGERPPIAGNAATFSTFKTPASANAPADSPPAASVSAEKTNAPPAKPPIKPVAAAISPAHAKLLADHPGLGHLPVYVQQQGLKIVLQMQTVKEIQFHVLLQTAQKHIENLESFLRTKGSSVPASKIDEAKDWLRMQSWTLEVGPNLRTTATKPVVQNSLGNNIAAASTSTAPLSWSSYAPIAQHQAQPVQQRIQIPSISVQNTASFGNVARAPLSTVAPLSTGQRGKVVVDAVSRGPLPAQTTLPKPASYSVPQADLARRFSPLPNQVIKPPLRLKSTSPPLPLFRPASSPEDDNIDVLKTSPGLNRKSPSSSDILPADVLVRLYGTFFGNVNPRLDWHQVLGWFTRSKKLPEPVILYCQQVNNSHQMVIAYYKTARDQEQAIDINSGKMSIVAIPGQPPPARVVAAKTTQTMPSITWDHVNPQSKAWFHEFLKDFRQKSKSKSPPSTTDQTPSRASFVHQRVEGPPQPTLLPAAESVDRDKEISTDKKPAPLSRRAMLASVLPPEPKLPSLVVRAPAESTSARASSPLPVRGRASTNASTLSSNDGEASLAERMGIEKESPAFISRVSAGPFEEKQAALKKRLRQDRDSVEQPPSKRPNTNNDLLSRLGSCEFAEVFVRFQLKSNSVKL